MPCAVAPAASAGAPFSPTTTRTLISLRNSILKPNPKLPSLSRHQSITTALSTTTASNPQLLDSGTELILHGIGLREREADALLLNHPSLRFASPESLRRRNASLQSTGLNGAALRRAILKRPDLLTSPELDPFLHFLNAELQGLHPIKIERLLVGTKHPLLFRESVETLLAHGFPRDNLVGLLNGVDVRKVFCEMPTHELEATIVFLKGYGWPDLVLRRPVLLNLDLRRQLVPRIDFLAELAGGDKASAAALIAKLPAILAYTVDHYQSHLEFWASVGLSDGQLFRIALVYPNIFSVSIERKLRQRIEFLQDCGLKCGDEIFKFLTKAPLFVSLSSRGNLSKKLATLVKIGYRHRTAEMATAVAAATRTSCGNLQGVVAVLLGYGLSCEDVAAMSRKHPQVLQYSWRSVEAKVEFLVGAMEREAGELLVFPAFLGYKLDDRIKTRYEAKKKVRGKKMSINKLLSVSSERFGLSLPDDADHL